MPPGAGARKHLERGSSCQVDEPSMSVAAPLEARWIGECMGSSMQHGKEISAPESSWEAAPVNPNLEVQLHHLSHAALLGLALGAQTPPPNSCPSYRCIQE
jgi:hypothetical protein